jgi:hypothetical protein
MQFYEVETLYRTHRKDLGYKDSHRFYTHIITHFEAWQRQELPPMDWYQNCSLNQLLVEALWHMERMPYYKIWAGVFDAFIKTRLDIDSSLVKLPHECFAIRLPKTDEPILSFDFDGGTAFVKSIIIQGADKIMEDGSKGSGIMLQICFESDGKIKVWNVVGGANMIHGKTIEECIHYDNPPNNVGLCVPESIIEACVRLSIATCFLATGSHKVLEYDVLTKHLDAYREEKEKNAAKRKDYEKQAKKKGKFGWNIGGGRTKRGLKLPNGVSYSSACKSAGGRELLYQHVRGGHWHTVRYGEGRQKIKVVWFEPTTVRGDLPPAPME